MIASKGVTLLICVIFDMGTADITRTDSNHCSSSLLDVNLGCILGSTPEKALNLLQTGALTWQTHVDKSEVVLNNAHLSRAHARKTKKQKEASPGTLLVVAVLFLVISAAVVVVYIVLEHRGLSRRPSAKGQLPQLASSIGPKKPWEEFRKGAEPIVSDAISPARERRPLLEEATMEPSRLAGIVSADPLSYQSAEPLKMEPLEGITEGHRHVAGREISFAPQHVDPLKWTHSTISETFVSREASQQSTPVRLGASATQYAVAQSMPLHQTLSRDPIGETIQSLSNVSPPQLPRIISAEVPLPPGPYGGCPLPATTLPPPPIPPAPMEPVRFTSIPPAPMEPVAMPQMTQQIPSGVLTIATQPVQVLSPQQQAPVFVAQVSQTSLDVGDKVAVPQMPDSGQLGLLLSEGPDGEVVVDGFTNEFGRSFGLKAGDQITGLNARPVTGKAMLLAAIAEADKLGQKKSFSIRQRVVSQVPQAVVNETTFVGRWGYADELESGGERYEYQLLPNQQGPGLVFMQTLPSQERVTGVVTLRGDNTVHGNLTKCRIDKTVEMFGELKLRFDPATQEMVSTLRMGAGQEWGDEVRASRLEVSL